ncbi:GntR family transcriptional regulator [Phaeovulum sp. W22_SRMD_FR3]|uniref:GntR family transcriptional regulator n=1 Tax=Phaeovulum sp. W22_SRMD_FR3 TaxID=3240274 RepID=UPI003F9E7762
MNDLHRSLSERILRHIRTSNLAEGTHLTEVGLQALFGTSRKPIRSALAHLETQGVLKRIPRRGYFLADPRNAACVALPSAEGMTDEALYLGIAAQKMDGALSDRVSEDALMRRFAVSRPQLRRVLTRIATEGWIERNDGRGWSFAALIDSVEAYRESYEFRQRIEADGLRHPNFRFDREVLAELRRRQEFVRDEGWSSLGRLDLFEANSEFHETLAGLSGNRFLLPTVRKLNQLRRLVEYRLAERTDQALGRNREHLAILDALDDRDGESAARLMDAHLGRARDRKALPGVF